MGSSINSIYDNDKLTNFNATDSNMLCIYETISYIFVQISPKRIKKTYIHLHLCLLWMTYLLYMSFGSSIGKLMHTKQRIDQFLPLRILNFQIGLIFTSLSYVLDSALANTPPVIVFFVTAISA